MTRSTQFSEEMILQAARCLLLEEGAQAVTFRRLSHRAGCSNQTLLRRFGTEQHLHTALARTLREELRCRVYAGDGETAQAFFRIPQVCIQAVYQEPEVIRFLYATSDRFLARGSVDVLFVSEPMARVTRDVAAYLQLPLYETQEFVQNTVIFVQGLVAMLSCSGVQMGYEEARELFYSAAVMYLTPYGVEPEKARNYFR